MEDTINVLYQKEIVSQKWTGVQMNPIVILNLLE
jgi:hypothetical protein